MAKSKGSTYARKAVRTEKAEACGADHEALLMTAYRELPEMLAEELHTVAPLNTALRKKAATRRDEIEEALSKVELPADQQDLWRAVPEIQFGTSDIPPPEFQLGLTLHRWLDGRGDRKMIPEALCVVDFCINVEIPTWKTGYLRTPHDRSTPLKSAVDALAGIGQSLTKHKVLGVVMTRQVTLGQAIREIERVRDAGMIDSVRQRHDPPNKPFIICVTDRRELYEVLRDKIDVMFVEDDELEFDLGFLRSQVKVQ